MWKATIKKVCSSYNCKSALKSNYQITNNMALIKSISGIRGTIGGKVGENLTPPDVVQFISAFFTFLKKNDTPLTIVVGRDARVSGEIINKLICSTLQSLGAHVIDLGLSTTPTVEMAVIGKQADGGVILTASHNPMHWNALKLLNSDGSLFSKALCSAIALLLLVSMTLRIMLE